MNKETVLKLFKNSGALLEGHFLLSSGLHSAAYLQCALVLQHPDLAGELCSELAGKFKDKKPNIVISPALGGVIVGHETARSLGVSGIFTERVHGRMCLRRGFTISKQDKIIIVEDVITTGKSTKEVIEVVKSFGAEIIGVGSIVDRTGGKVDFGIDYRSLLKIEIPAFEAKSCPLCKENIPVVKPGSR